MRRPSGDQRGLPPAWMRQIPRLADDWLASTAPTPTHWANPSLMTMVKDDDGQSWNDVGELSRCKHSASIRLPQRRYRVPPKRTAAAENWLEACISAEYGGTRVHNRGGS
jgi:hypothetical protein